MSGDALKSLLLLAQDSSSDVSTSGFAAGHPAVVPRADEAFVVRRFSAQKGDRVGCDCGVDPPLVSNRCRRLVLLREGEVVERLLIGTC